MPELDPEVRWRSLVSLFFNYIVAVHNVLTEEVGVEVTTKIQTTLAKVFWEEQAQAFVDLFDLKPGNAKDAHALKRIFASLLDIRYETQSEKTDEVVDKMEYSNCPFRITLEPIWDSICMACELIGQTFIDKLDPNFKHTVKIKGDACYHTTKLKKRA